MEITTIKLEKQTKDRIDKLKEHERESYNQVIKKILHLLNIVKKNPEAANRILKTIDKRSKTIHKEYTEKYTDVEDEDTNVKTKDTIEKPREKQSKKKNNNSRKLRKK
jgi:hypothetical protein